MHDDHHHEALLVQILRDFSWTLRCPGPKLVNTCFSEVNFQSFTCSIGILSITSQCAIPIPEYCNVSTADNFHLKPFIDDL